MSWKWKASLIARPEAVIPFPKCFPLKLRVSPCGIPNSILHPTPPRTLLSSQQRSIKQGDGDWPKANLRTAVPRDSHTSQAQDP